MSNQPPPTPPATPPGAGPHKEPSDSEEVYYEGSPPWRGLGGKVILWPLAGLAFIAIPFVAIHWGHHVPALGWLIHFVVGLSLPWVPILHAKTIHYRITSYRIDYERGLFSKDIDTIELWHVEDLHFHQSLWERIMGVGRIRIVSHDATLPELILRGVPNPRPLFETLKQRVIAVKRARGVIKVDPG